MEDAERPRRARCPIKRHISGRCPDRLRRTPDRPDAARWTKGRGYSRDRALVIDRCTPSNVFPPVLVLIRKS